MTPTTAVPAYPISATGDMGPCGEQRPSRELGPAETLRVLVAGLQVVREVGGEMTVLRASAALEQARPWAGRVPEIAKN